MKPINLGETKKKTTKSFKISNLKDTLCEYRRDSKEERINGKCEIITEKNRKKKKKVKESLL